jgi:hypothetical protein
MNEKEEEKKDVETSLAVYTRCTSNNGSENLNNVNN